MSIKNKKTTLEKYLGLFSKKMTEKYSIIFPVFYGMPSAFW